MEIVYVGKDEKEIVFKIGDNESCYKIEVIEKNGKEIAMVMVIKK